MGLLDSLFSGNMPMPEQQGGQEALLADLFRRLQAGQAPGVTTTQAPPETSMERSFMPTSAAAQGMTIPAPALEQRQVQDAPQGGTPYAPPAASVAPADIVKREAAMSQPAPAMPQQRQPNVWDSLSRLSRGYNSGGLVGGIADMMNTDRDAQEMSATANAMASKLGDPALAQFIVRDPALMKSVMPLLFSRDPVQVVEVYDAQGRPQKALLNPKTGQMTPVGGAKGDMTKPPQGYEWTDPSNHSAGVRRMPGFEDKIPGEVAGKVAMMSMARERIAQSRKVFERDWGAGDIGKWVAGNVPGAGDISALSGDVGIAQRDIRTGIEAALRTMTGAAAPEQEVQRYMQMFMPNPKDTKESAKQKIDGLMKFMEEAEKYVLQGRGVTPTPTAPPAAPPAPAVQPVAPAAAPQAGTDAQTAIREAQAAIAKGADPKAVAARLKQMGLDMPMGPGEM